MFNITVVYGGARRGTKVRSKWQNGTTGFLGLRTGKLLARIRGNNSSVDTGKIRGGGLRLKHMSLLA